jgi:hypothetical protein
MKGLGVYCRISVFLALLLHSASSSSAQNELDNEESNVPNQSMRRRTKSSSRTSDKNGMDQNNCKAQQQQREVLVELESEDEHIVVGFISDFEYTVDEIRDSWLVFHLR